MNNKYSILMAVAAASMMWSCGGSESPDGPDGPGEENKVYAVGKPLPAWSEGCLDIHHINTGRGECQLIIMPDGTTMLVDAGEFATNNSISNPPDRQVPQRPNDATRPYVTQVRYIRNFTAPTTRTGIDYAVMTHFHTDHMGSIDSKYAYASEGGYVLTGITAIGTQMPLGTVVDRGYPTYNVGAEIVNTDMVDNYRKFMDYQTKNKGVKLKGPNVGSDTEFPLLVNASKYPTFNIRTVAANGYAWTGAGVNTTNVYAGKTPAENACSIALLLTYGKFKYYTGGDLATEVMERAVGKAIGEVDVCKAGHHMSWVTMCADFMKSTRPRVIVNQNFFQKQPDIGVLTRLLSESDYVGPRTIYTSNMKKEVITSNGSIVSQLAGYDGHIVIRVHPGGDSYSVYMLDDTNFEYEIKSMEENIVSK